MTSEVMIPVLTKQEALQKISKIDLTDIANRLSQVNGFDTERITKAVRMYRKFLALMVMHPDVPISPPSIDADEVWHQHLLFTKKYHSDCDFLFGSYRHHTPLAASSSEQEVADQMIRKLWAQHGFQHG